MSSLNQAGPAFLDWMKTKALPLWASLGADPAGGFYEKLTPDGTPDTASPRRVRVQSRQVYVYSHAATLGWFDGAKAASDHGWSFLLERGYQGGDESLPQEKRGCAHLLGPDASLMDDLRDTYAQAFVILASAWRWRAFGDETARQYLYGTTEFLQTRVKAENGGWREGVPASLPRRQNPHMHLFEAFMAAWDATGDPLFRSLSDEVLDLFKKHFYHPATGALLEFFAGDWSLDPERGSVIEPGHMMEWCWLLRQYEQRFGADISAYADGLYDYAIAVGMNDATGLMVDEVELDGASRGGISRMWPQTEYIKASLAQAQAGHEGARNSAAVMIERMMNAFMTDNPAGGWVDRIGAEGNIVDAQMPSSTFYHLMAAAVEVEKDIKCSS